MYSGEYNAFPQPAELMASLSVYKKAGCFSEYIDEQVSTQSVASITLVALTIA